MKLRLKGTVLAGRVTIAAAILATTVVLLVTVGCATRERTMAPAPAPGVTGTVVALKDDRPADGGVELTMKVGGLSDLWRTPSPFVRPQTEENLAIQAVVDRIRVGDRLRATGRRDEFGALQVEALEIVNQP